MIDIRVPQNGRTFYGNRILSFKKIFHNIRTEQAIRTGLNSVFGGIGISEKLLTDTIDHCVNSMKHCSDLLHYEYSVRTLLDQKNILDKYNASKKSRSSIRIEKVAQYLVGKTVLDLGCGSSKIGLAIKNKGYEVTLADIYRNNDISASGLSFYQITDGEPLSFEGSSFDNVLILSMLHHTQSPLHAIHECRRILKNGGRLHLIETVYGIRAEAKGGYGTEDLSFRSLSSEQQRKVTMFFDYFANHILDGYTKDPNTYIPVPFNFTTPDNLERIFRENGFTLVSKENLGIYPFSYVYHVHHTYDKLYA